jgi:hypothetical protein
MTGHIRSCQDQTDLSAEHPEAPQLFQYDKPADMGNTLAACARTLPVFAEPPTATPLL